jgi:hypothetical protein
MNHPPNFRRLYLGLSCLLGLPLIFGCVDPIELPTPDLPEAVMVVQGKLLYGKPGKVSVQVYVAFPASGNIIQPIGGASVNLEADNGKKLKVNAVSPAGTYERVIEADDAEFPLLVGGAYRIQVALPNGKEFRSAWDLIRDVVAADSLSVTYSEGSYVNSNGFTVIDTFMKFGIHTGLGAGDAKFRWETDQGFRLTDNTGKTCYVVRSLLADNVFAFDGGLTAANRLSPFPLFETRVDYRFAEGFYLLVYQQHIGADAYAYFEELAVLLNKRGTLFDPPVGQIRSNITSLTDPELPTQGYFYVGSQDTIRRYISPSEARYPKRYCPLPPVNGEAPRPTSCDDCLLEQGAQVSRPAWWQ